MCRQKNQISPFTDYAIDDSHVLLSVKTKLDGKFQIFCLGLKQ